MLIWRVSGIRNSDKANRRNCDWVDQRIGETTRRRVSRCGDEWHQPATPAITNHVRHGYRRVADPGGEEFSEERADRPVDHPDIGDQNEDNETRRSEERR